MEEFRLQAIFSNLHFSGSHRVQSLVNEMDGFAESDEPESDKNSHFTKIIS